MAQSFTAMDVKLATPVTKVVDVTPSMIGEKDFFFIIASPTDGNARVMLSPLAETFSALSFLITSLSSGTTDSAEIMPLAIAP